MKLQDLVASGKWSGERDDTLRPRGGVPLHPYHHPLQNLPTCGDVDREILRFWEVLASLSIFCAQLRAVLPWSLYRATPETDGRYLRDEVFWRGAINRRRRYLQVYKQ